MKTQSAFTLVELSIVLVILGLLVGGVLTGQSLIRSAELRAITTERDKFTTALYAFQDKYMALPGDMPNAFAYWGSLGKAGCATDDLTVDTGCNGDGNGQIGINSGDVNEPSKSWMHLSLSGLIEGAYDGTSANYPNLPNAPKSKLPNSLWALTSFSLGNVATNTSYLFGGLYLQLSNVADGGLSSLTHGEAWILDQKMDDGHANTGRMRGDDGGDCFDEGVAHDDYYGVQSAGANFKGDCTLTFILKD